MWKKASYTGHVWKGPGVGPRSIVHHCHVERRQLGQGFCLLFVWGGMPHSIWTLVPLPGIKAAPPAVGAQY